MSNVDNPNIIIRNSSGTELATNTNPLRVDPTGTTAQPATQSGTWAVRAQDGAGNALASAATAPTGTEQALVVRNIPSGTQAVSGTVAATQSGTWNIGNITGTISLPTGASTSALQTTGNSSLSSIDGKTPSLGQALMAASSPVVIASNQSAIPVTGTFFQATQPVSIAASVAVTGPLTDAQLRATPVPVSGTITATNAAVGATGSAPPASASLTGGSVTTAAPTYTTGQMSALSLNTSGGLRVDGSGVTQPISAASLPLPTGAATQTTLASIDTKTPALGQAVMASSVPVAIASNQSAIPVSGTVTVNQGTANTNTNGWYARITDGTNNAVVKAASTAAVATDPALVVAISPNNSVAVTGPLTDAQLRATAVPVSQSGTWTVQPGNTANTTAWLVAGGKTNNGAAPGTNNFGTLPAVATAAAPTYTAGNQVALSTDLSGALRIAGAITATSASDGSTGAAVPSVANFGGASDGTNLIGLRGSTTTPAGTEFGLIVRNIPSGTQTVSGTVTANAGSGTFAISAASLPLPTGAATEATLSAMSAKLPATLGQKPMATSLAVAIASDQGALPVSGTFFQATQPVSIAATVAVSAASLPLPTGASTEATLAKLAISQGTALGTNTQAMVGGSVTTAAPTYTTGTIQPLSIDTAGALRVAGTFSASAPSGTTTTGNISAASATGQLGTSLSAAVPAANSFVTATLANHDSVSLSVTGTWSGVLTFEATIDGTNWFQIYGQIPGWAGPVGAITTGVAAQFNTAGMSGFRVRAVTGTTGFTSVAVNIRANFSASGTVSIANALPGQGPDGGGQPGYINLVGGMNGAALRAAQLLTTTPAGTEQGLVVRNIPSGTQTVSGTVTSTMTDTVTGSTALGAANATIQVALAGQNSVGFQLSAGTLIGTLIPECSLDGGTTWVTTQFNDPANGGSSNPNTAQIVFASSNTAQTRSIAIANGASHARVRVFPYTSGTANATLRATGVQGVQRIVGAAAELDSTANVNPVLIAGTTGGGFVKAINVNSFGYITTVGAGFAGGPSGGVVTVQGDPSGSAVPVSYAAQATVSGSLAALNATVVIPSTKASSYGIAVFGTWVGTIQPEFTLDGTNWAACRVVNRSTNDILQTIPSGANDHYFFYDVGGSLQLRLRMSAYTSGSATITLTGTMLETKELLNYSGTDNDAAPPLRHLSLATLTSTDGTLRALRQADADPAGTEFGLLTRSMVSGAGMTGFGPDPQSVLSGSDARLLLDVTGNLMTRGAVITDELSFRDDFSGTSLNRALSGTVTFTNGSAIVTGVGSTFSTQVKVGDYVRLTADGDAAWALVDTIDSDLQLTLAAAYTGAGGTTAPIVSNWKQSVGAGASTSVGSSIATINAGTTANSITSLIRNGDYGPFTKRCNFTAPNRVANSTWIYGFTASGQPVSLLPGPCAWFEFTGTSNTVVTTVTGSGTTAADQQRTTVTLPGGVTTAVQHEWKLDVSPNQVTFSMDGQILATHNLHIPGPYDRLDLVIAAINGSVAPAATTSTVEVTYFQNVDRLQIDDDFNGEPLRVQPAIEPVVASGTLNALNAAISLPAAAEGSVGFNLTAGTLIGTLVPEVSFDGGTTWEISTFNGFSAGRDSSIVFAAANTNQSRTVLVPGGATHARVRVSAFTSGTAAASLRLVNNTETGVQIIQGSRAAYTVGVSGQANTAASHSIVIEASATKRILVRKLIILQPGTQTTAGFRSIYLERTTGAGTAGVLTFEPNNSPTGFVSRMDQKDPAFGGICRGKPTTLGTQGTTLFLANIWVPNVGTTFTQAVQYDFEALFGKPFVIQPGTTNGIALRDPGAAGAANFAAQIIFTEE